MKLLSKQKIALDTALIRKNQIDEGVSLAKKVDALRKQVLELENHRNFIIKGTKNAIEESTKEAQDKLEEVNKKLEVARNEYKKLKKPLDKEWEQLKEGKLILQKEKEEFLKNKVELEQDSILLNSDRKLLNELIDNQTTLLAEIRINTEESRIAKEISVDNLNKSREILEKTNEEIAQRKKDIQIEEEKVKFDKQSNKQVSENNERKEKELIILETQLRDKQKTLERAFNRLQNGKR